MEATGRMSIACNRCAKAKVKCDKQIPCSRCASRQVVCQSRSPRTSADTLVHRAHRLLSPSKKIPGYLHRNSLSKTSESVGRQANSIDHQLQWTIHSYASSGHSAHHSAPMEALMGFNHSMQKFTQHNHMKSEAHILDSLHGSSPDLSFPPTPIMQNARIEDFVQMNEAHWDQKNDQQTKMITDMQTLSAFEVPNLTDFISPMISISNPSENLDFDVVPGLSQNTSAAWNTSSKSSAYPSSNQILSDVSSLDSRQNSYHSQSASCQRTIQEHQSLIAAEAHWRSFRCNPLMNPNACPKTENVHLEGLEQTLKNQEAWNHWDTQPHDFAALVDQKILAEPFLGNTRDELLVVTRSLLQKSLVTHSDGISSLVPRSSSIVNSRVFTTLPPSYVLEYFLRAYLCCYEPYYPSIPARRLKTNELIQPSTGNISSLLLLLMIAQGAMATPTVEARYLTSGLTEVCRISLIENIEKSASLHSQPIVLRCALLLTNLAAWSGDKWHMDIAMGQREMYLEILTNTGMLEFREIRLSPCESEASLGQAWKEWKEHESRSRLVYSWVTVDQELSLFQDTAPILAVANLHTTMPDAEILWHARSASEWSKCFQGISRPPYKRPPSLCDLFQRFLEAGVNVAKDCNKISATQLRLLLHPLQAMVHHLRQLLSCFPPDGFSNHRASQVVSRSATSARLEGVQSLLQQWYAISVQCAKSSMEFCPVSCANSIMYHLISLNRIVCFVEIERLARYEGVQEGFRHFQRLQMCCLEQAREIFFHCGQILRLARSMPHAVQPAWWAAAVYRVALISWVDSMASADARFHRNRSAPKESGRPFAIDILQPENPSIWRYLKFQEGIPTLTKRDGSAVSLAVPGDVLTHCVEVLGEESTTRFASGIKNKLERLAERWKNRM